MTIVLDWLHPLTTPSTMCEVLPRIDESSSPSPEGENSKLEQLMIRWGKGYSHTLQWNSIPTFWNEDTCIQWNSIPTFWNEDTSVYSGTPFQHPEMRTPLYTVELLYSNTLKWGHLCIQWNSSIPTPWNEDTSVYSGTPLFQHPEMRTLHLNKMQYCIIIASLNYIHNWCVNPLNNYWSTLLLNSVNIMIILIVIVGL